MLVPALDVAGARGDRVRRDHPGSGIALGRTQRDAGAQHAGRVEQLRALGRQLPGGPARRQHLGQEVGQAESRRSLGDESVEAAQQLSVVVAGGGIDGEHPRRVADAEHRPTRELGVHVPGEGRERRDARHVRLVVEHRLVHVGDRPAERDVRAEELTEFGGRARGGRVAPGAERHQQLAVRVEGQVPVHHRRNADRTDGLQPHAVALLRIGDQLRVRGADAGPDVVERVGPDAVAELVLPVVSADREHLGSVGADQAGLDAGRPELDPEGGTTGEDRLPRGVSGGTVHGGLLVE